METDAELEHDSLGQQFAADQTRGSDIAERHARAQVYRRIFGSTNAPQRLGRFTILERIGHGGMGTVYAAYDPRLDRRVAIKLLNLSPGRSQTRARLRLIREARALARLSHANVVPVYEVDEDHDRIFLVMEYMRGQTFDRWLAREQPGPRAILRAFVSAGRGLAAAHALGIVHRDFKPSNVMLGADQRVRVFDFGLATQPATRHAKTKLPKNHAKSSAAASELTHTGTVLGTPAYMAPEQKTTAEVSPRADQYSFCTALFEALYGHRPELGAHTPWPRRPGVPARVRTALQRGLAERPNDRFPSINELLGHIEVGNRHVHFSIGVLLLAWLVVIGLGTARSLQLEADRCRQGPQRVAHVWPGTEGNRARDLRSLAPHNKLAVAKFTSTRLQAYAKILADAYTSSCQAHHTGASSDTLFDHQTACLDRQLVALSRSLEVLERHASTAFERSPDVVAALPQPSACLDRAQVLSAAPPPNDPERRARAAALEGELSEIRALTAVGQNEPALAKAEQLLAEAGELNHPPLLARSWLQLGRTAMRTRNQPERSARALKRATELGLELRNFDLAVEAFARRVYLSTSMDEERDKLLAQAEIFEQLAEAADDDGFAKTLLWNNLGVVANSQGDRQTAQRWFTRAQKTIQAMAAPQLELTCVARNAAMLCENPRRREQLLRQVIAQLTRELGPANPRTLEARVALAHHVEDVEVAVLELEQTCPVYRHALPSLVYDQVQCAYFLGHLYAQLGQREAARATWATLVELDRRSMTPLTRADVDLSQAFAHLLGGDTAAARALFLAIEAELDADSPHWWVRKRSAHARIGRGICEVDLGLHGAARHSLHTGLQLLSEIRSINHDFEHELKAASAERALAQLHGPTFEPPVTTVRARN